MSQLPIALTVAGFDPCGGAGLQADLKTFQAYGVYGLSVATAITIQNTQGVEALYPLPADQVRQQLSNLLEDFDIQAVKVGMLGSPENAEVVAEFVEDGAIKIVFDPIIKSQSGFLLNDLGFLEELISHSLLITPNTDEAAQLCGFDVKNKEGMRKAAAYLYKLGVGNVLIKGGHLAGNKLYDLFFNGVDYSFRQYPKIAGPSPHGTGCILSAAIAANLAQGKEMAQAISNAQDYLYNLRQNPLTLGKGYPLLFSLPTE